MPHEVVFHDDIAPSVNGQSGAHSPVADEKLRCIAALYAIEQQGAALDPRQRLVLRQKLAMPALTDLHTWLPAATEQPMPSTTHSSAGRRCSAMRPRARGQSTITRSRTPSFRLPAARRTVCSPVRSGSARAAAIQRLFGTAKLNGLDPARCLATVLEHLP